MLFSLSTAEDVYGFMSRRSFPCLDLAVGVVVAAVAEAESVVIAGGVQRGDGGETAGLEHAVGRAGRGVVLDDGLLGGLRGLLLGGSGSSDTLALGGLAGRGELGAVDLHELVLALLDRRGDGGGVGGRAAEDGLTLLLGDRLLAEEVLVLGVLTSAGLDLGLSLGISLQDGGRAHVRVASTVVNSIGGIALGAGTGLAGGGDVEAVVVVLGRVDVALDVAVEAGVVEAGLGLDLLTTAAAGGGEARGGSGALAGGGRGRGQRSLDALTLTSGGGADDDAGGVAAAVGGLLLGLADGLDLAEVKLQALGSGLAKELLDLCSGSPNVSVLSQN